MTDGEGSAWTCLADEVTGLEGRGLMFAGPTEADRVAAAVAAAGYRVVNVQGGGVNGFREAQARIAAALGLPEAAGRNLDALADSLRDLALYWPDDERIALLWHDAGELVGTDLEGWFRLSAVLEDATDELWSGQPGDRLFETVLFVNGLDE